MPWTAISCGFVSEMQVNLKKENVYCSGVTAFLPLHYLAFGIVMA